MRDRWQKRADTPPGNGTVYWHILMGGYPEVRSLAEHIQKQLAQFSGLHMTPLDRLHMTTLVAGSANEITSAQMQRMLGIASQSLAKVSPIKVSLGHVLYHPEAIMLGVEASESLAPILHAARTATQAVIGRDGVTTSGSGSWIPHMTLCYSTAKQPAKPLIDTLGTTTSSCEITIKTLTLVTQWGPERDWDWQPIGVAELGTE
ncbi:2'-5' RNA ligase family protein [Spirillospora sp. NPDC127506]